MPRTTPKRSFHDCLQSVKNDQPTCVFGEDVASFGGGLGVHGDDSLQGRHAVQAETARAAHHRPDRVLGALDQPEI